MIILDDYKDKISFYDEYQRYVSKCGKLCVTNVLITVHEDITIQGTEWAEIMELPYVPDNDIELCHSPLISLAGEISFPMVANNGKVCFLGGTVLTTGTYYCHWTYFSV